MVYNCTVMFEEVAANVHYLTSLDELCIDLIQAHCQSVWAWWLI